MANSEPRSLSTPQQPANFSTQSWQVLKKRRGQLIAASVLLAIWIIFLVMMAAYN